MTTHRPGPPRPRTPALSAAAFVVALSPTVACSTATPASLAIHPGANFAAHAVRGGLMVDAMEGGTPTPVLEPSGFSVFGHSTSIVDKGPARGEAVTVCGPGCAVVRASDDANAPVIGRVDPDWQDGSLKLRIDSANGVTLQTGRFKRADWRGGHSTLSRTGQTTLGIPGIYRAAIRDPQGRDVGWLSVRVFTQEAGYPHYEAILPPGVNEGVAAAAAEAVGAEVAWIENHSYDPTYARTQEKP